MLNFGVVQIQPSCPLKNSGWNGSLFTEHVFSPPERPFFEIRSPPLLRGKNPWRFCFFFQCHLFFKMARHVTLCEIIKHWYSTCFMCGWVIYFIASVLQAQQKHIFLWKFVETCLLLRWFHLAYLVSDFLRNSVQFQKSYGCFQK